MSHRVGGTLVMVTTVVIMKAVFLDRDGVINEEPGDALYVTSWEKFLFLPRAKEALVYFHKNNFRVYVISNQAGVGKGFFTQQALDTITEHMRREIELAGGKLSGVYYCIHRPEDECPCRKPKPGLFDIVRQETGIDPAGFFFIGDTIRDVKTARASGCKSIMVLSGKEAISNRNNWELQPDFVFHDLYEAAEFITAQGVGF